MQLSARTIRVAVFASAFAILPAATLVFNPLVAQNFVDLLSRSSNAQPLCTLASSCLPAGNSEIDGSGASLERVTILVASLSLILLALGAATYYRSLRRSKRNSDIDDGRILAAMCYVARASGGIELKELGRIFTQITGHIATERQLEAAYRAFNANAGGIELTPFARAGSDAERTAIMLGALRVAWYDGRLRQSAQHLIGKLAHALDMSETRVLELFDTIHNPPRRRMV